MDDQSKNHANPQSPASSPLRPRPQVTAAALSHDPFLDELPRLVAAGRGRWAEEILRIAFERGIKVREDAPLAEMLAAMELDSPIPTEAIMAVAEILAYVYAAENPHASVTLLSSDATTPIG